MLIKTPSQIGNILKQRRLALGYDQQSVAKQAGITRVWLAAIEKGAAGTSVRILLRLMAVLRLTMTISPSEHAGDEQRTSRRRSDIPSINLNTVIEALRKSQKK